MSAGINEILSDLKNHLIHHYGDSVKDVVLFGSQARGDSDKFSDYDVLIILKNDYTGKDENRLLDLCYDIDLKYDILLDVHIISNNELNTIRGKQPIFINAIKSGIYA
jgi:predicted nucleotidyltransferase